MAMPPDGIASTWLTRRSASVSESERASLFIPFIIAAPRGADALGVARAASQPNEFGSYRTGVRASECRGEPGR